MSAMLPPGSYISEAPQVYPSLRWGYHPATIEPELEHPMVRITGDIRLCVSQLEAALSPIIGLYSIETTGMQEPLYTLWHADGQVLSRRDRSTGVAFDMRGARAGETRTYQVAVQVTERGEQGRVMLCGVFVQVAVTNDDLPDANL